jgi:hypothetical protein
MTENLENHDLAGRLNLIETMIAEGRSSTQRWAWTFLLWGIAYYVAIAWATWGKTWVAWPVTMIAAAIVTGVFVSRIKRSQPGTTVGRAMGAIWSVMGTVLFVVLMALGFSGRADLHLIVTISGAMLATANGVSSMVLRWKMQFACALVWLALAVGACFTTDMQTAMLSLAAIFFCQIVFGIYGMALESRRQSRSTAHA